MLLTGAACSGSNDVAAPTLTPLPSTSTSVITPSASPSISPSLVAKAGPPPKTPFTKEGAELFVRAYYATASRALVSGMTTDLRQYEGDACQCLGLADWIDGFHAKGEHFKGMGYQIHQIEQRESAGNSAVVAATWSMAHMPFVNRSGRQVDRSTAVHRQTDLLILYYVGRDWKIGKIIAGPPR
jgi:hypothetical protein